MSAWEDELDEHPEYFDEMEKEIMNEQLQLEYEAFATEEQVARLQEAYKLACNACAKLGAVEYRTNPDTGTYHTTNEWMTYFLEAAKERDYKLVSVVFAVDPVYPTYEDWE